MAWSKTVNTYPPQARELFVKLMDTGVSTTHTFTDKNEAAYFARMINALRNAFIHDKSMTESYRYEASQYTTEMSDDGLTVTLLSTANTKRGRMAAKALAEQVSQFKEQGISLTEGQDKGI